MPDAAATDAERADASDGAGAAVAEPADGAEVGGRLASGVRWGVLNQIVQQATRLAVQLVLTRLLAPSAFGLVALAFVIVNLGSLMSGLGFSQALIQRPRLERRTVDAAFLGSTLLALALTLVVLVGAAPIARLLGDPAVAPVLRALSVVFLLQGLEGVPNSLLRRALRFRAFVLSSTVAAVVGGALGITLGLAGAGVWALVGFAVTEAVVASGLAWVLAIRAGVWRPALRLDLRPLRDVLGYSGAVTGNRLLAYGVRNVDNLIVGRALGAAALGHYGLAYRLMLFPLQRATDVIVSVTLPGFARMQQEPARLRAAYLRAVRYLALVVVPVTVGVAVSAHHLVPGLFGPQWEPAVAPLQILALSGPGLAMVRLNGNLWEATGRAGLSLVMTGVGLGLLVPGFLIGVRHGVVGVAVAYTVTIYLGLAPALWVLRRTTGTSIGAQLRNVAPVLAASVALVVAARGAAALVPAAAGHLVALVAMVPAGAIGYVAALSLLDRRLLVDAFADLRRRPS